MYICNLTSRSYREVLGDVGWLGPDSTLAVWFGTLLAYILLALVEEQHLLGLFGDQYRDYRAKVPFMIPWVRTRSRWMELLLSILTSAALLWGLIIINRFLYR